MIPILTQTVNILQGAVEGVQKLSDAPAEDDVMNVSTGVVEDIGSIVNFVAPVVQVCTFSTSSLGSC